ncbi:MAG: hemolysin family protein [Pseudomonadota bacterium]
MLVGIFFIGAALLFTCGIVALEVALLDSRRAFLPQSSSQNEDAHKLAELEAESSVSVTDFIIASRLVTVLLLVLVGGVAEYLLLRGAVSSVLEAAVSGADIVSPILSSLYGAAIVFLAIAVGYIVPHFIGTRFRDAVLEYLSPLGRAVVRCAWPAIAMARLMKQIGARSEKSPAVEEEAIEEDIRSLVEEGERAGVIEEEEREMISRVFRLGDKPIASLMTSRSDVVFLDIGMTVKQAVEVALDSRLTWFPVRQGIDDEVVGIVSVHDVFSLKDKQTSESVAKLKDISAPAMDVPESMTALELLERFKEQGEHFAVVRDEYGSVAGIATVDDVLRVVMGDMSDVNGDERSITVRDDGSLLVDASLDVQNLFERLGFADSSDGDQGQFHSVGGFVMTSLGHIPKPGDSFMREGHRFEVVDMDGKRIDKVLVARIADQKAVGG